MAPKHPQPASNAVTAVFDIGKTNKKLFVFDTGYQIVFEKQVCLPETVDEDGEPCEDLSALTDFIWQSLAGLARSRVFDLKAVNFSAYGASLVYIGEDGKRLTPVYSYLKPYPEELSRRFFATHGDQSLLSRKSACQLEGSINAGLQLYRLKSERPDIFERTARVLFLPQYLRFLFTGEAYAEMTSIGCHTGMWDFEEKRWQSWLKREGIQEKLPPIAPAGKMTPVQLEGKKLSVGVGLHDSSSALAAYQASCREPFTLISTGTWCVSLNPFARELLTAEELNTGCLCYLDAAGQPVKASRRMLGRKYEAGTPMGEIIREQLESTRMVIDESTQQLFVDGGFAKNEEYMQGFREGFSGRDVRAAGLPHASALGAAMIMKNVL